MAKKSNKTEHVLKLITKNDEDMQDEDFFVIKPEISEYGASAVRGAEPEKAGDDKDEIELSTAPPSAAVSYEEPPEESPQVKEAARPEPPAGRAFKEQEKAGSAMPEQNDNLVNIAEILAREKLALVMERMKVCSCKTCINDVLALALNSLPTKYVTTDSGKQYFQLDIYKKQYETDILAALTKACVRVKASPRH